MANEEITQSRRSYHRSKKKHSIKTKHQPRYIKSEPTKKKRSVLSRVMLVVTTLLALVLIGGAAYAIKLYSKTAGIIDGSYTPISTRHALNQSIDPIKDPVSILLLGVDNNDERELDSTRTDAMILLTISPTEDTINMVSIPRDTYTYIEVADYYQGFEKINTAYALGESYGTSIGKKTTEAESAEASIDAVENLFNVPINYYITVDFNAFESVVDAFGGVEVDVPYDIVEQNAKGKRVVDLKEGRQELNGEEALAFARTRKKDNDIERGNRQQEVLTALMKKAMSVGTITKLESVLNAMDGHFWTNLDRNTILKIGESGLKNTYAFNTYSLSWMSFDYYGGNYVGLHQDSIDYISHKMNVSLGKEAKDERDAEGFEYETNGVVSPSTYPQDGMAVPN